MSKTETTKDERALLTGIDAKLTALLALLLRSSTNTLEGSSVSVATSVGFLAGCGLDVDDIAKIVGTTKDGARMALSRSKKKR